MERDVSKYNVIAKTTYHPSREYAGRRMQGEIYWHQPVSGVAEVEGRFVLWCGEAYLLGEMCVGLEGQCIAIAIGKDGTGYKLYTDTPTEGSTVEGIRASFARKGNGHRS